MDLSSNPSTNSLAGRGPKYLRLLAEDRGNNTLTAILQQTAPLQQTLGPRACLLTFRLAEQPTTLRREDCAAREIKGTSPKHPIQSHNMNARHHTASSRVHAIPCV
ncbi:hypothetical protein PoB_006574600 [Plakobranchus ocellatus]|uniref:Uncharacterized protein n=1 Tax=Plakobranchus ocellatus TaxID=259542 RepID=A0AAV4D5J8_9GAST|nr:hypothetical protein PoB_006574600 [Plakobranchus ocellatus]